MPSEPLLPIREIARLTGVNPVTLRAWERRYGLVAPQRTGKGHRLYSREQVERVRSILSWLDRGVSVSQVLPLLEGETEPGGNSAGDDWHALRTHLTDSISHLAERQLDQHFNQAMALYPASTLCEQLLSPLLNELELRWQLHPAARLEQGFFYSWLRSKLGLRVYHNNRQASGAPVVLMNGGSRAFDAPLWLCAWLVSDSGCPVEVFDSPLHARDLALGVERLNAKAVLISLGTALDRDGLQRLSAPLAVPKLLFGAAVLLHKQALADCHLLDSPLAASRYLHRLAPLARTTPDPGTEPCN